MLLVASDLREQSEKIRVIINDSQTFVNGKFKDNTFFVISLHEDLVIPYP